MSWFPDAIVDPGLNTNYRRGRTTNQMDVSHETVGRDSRALIRDRGLAAFLFPKRGKPFQFCPDNAVTSHACEFNFLGAGFEVERFPGEPMTADQTYWVGRVLRWRHETRGIPLNHWPKSRGRLPIGTGFRGTADHGGLVHRACDQHTDGWPGDEYQRALAAGGDMPLDSADILKVAGAVQTAVNQLLDPRLDAIDKVLAELKAKPPGTGITKAELDAALKPFRSLLPGE